MRSVRIPNVIRDPRAWLCIKLALALLVMSLSVDVLDEILIVGVANAWHGIDIEVVSGLIEQLPLGTDQVHIHLALSTLTAVRARGIAVAGLPGGWLQHTFPSFFLDPTFVVPGAWISAVLSRGSSLPALYVTRALVQVLVLVLGSVLVRIGLRPHWRLLVDHPRLTLSWPAAWGLYFCAQGTWALIRQTPTALDLEYLGLGLIVRNLLPGQNDTSQWLIANVLPPAVPAVFILLGVGLLPTLGSLAGVIRRARARFISRDSLPVSKENAGSGPVFAGLQNLLIGFALMLAISILIPRNIFAETNVRFAPPSSTPRTGEHARRTGTAAPIVRKQTRVSPGSNPEPTAMPLEVAFQSQGATTPTPIPAVTLPPVSPEPRSSPKAVPTASPGPTPLSVIESSSQPVIVRIHWSPAIQRFVLTNKDGQRFMIRGVNYNTHYTQLPKAEQLRILNRDFKQMRDVGVNTITGYATYDETTLEVAQTYGLYVIMPFVPDLNGDYTDPNYRDQVKRELTAFIRRYENYTSLLMWNFDDEPVHNMSERLGRPVAQVQAFSDFLIELAEHAYTVDRYHRPTWLKEPRDWYLDITGKSIALARNRIPTTPGQGRKPLDPNRYVVLARSAYGVPFDINEWLPQLATLVEKDLNMPFAVGEYGVVGLGIQDRAFHLVEIWTEAHDASAIGSAVYTYTPFQPDPGDPTDPAIADQLKLVDDSGVPVDDALQKLGEMWLAQETEEKDNLNRSSIPLARPEFQELVQQWGGYPSSGPILEADGLKQYFVQGQRQGRSVAYALAWITPTLEVKFAEVDSVVFNEMGEYTLAGPFLAEYMSKGGYARFGAPVSQVYQKAERGPQLFFQEFAKGLALAIPGTNLAPLPKKN